MGTYETSYSIGVGGVPGYLNIGGWNCTLTDVNTTPAVAPGMVRQEGANKYMYAMNGSQSAARGQFVQICTALADDSAASGLCPIRFTASPYTTQTAVGKVFGVVVATNIYTNQYGWILRQGVMTGYWATNTAGNIAGGYFAPSATTNHVFTNVASNTAVGFVLDPVATATAACGSAGCMVYINLEASVASP